MKFVFYITFMMMLLFNQSFGAADAGADQTLNITPSVRAVYLDGSASTPAGGTVTYTWYEGDKYIGPNKSRWYVIEENGEHTITLKFKDANGVITEDEMVVTVTGGTNPSPTLHANAGPDQTLNITPSVRAVYLDGSASTPNDGIVSYAWWEGEKFIGPNKSRWYVIEENGEHTITLKVKDENDTISEDNMVVTVNNGTGEENHSPVITLLGDAQIMLTVGDTYTDAGATANDSEDGNITANIVSHGMVDTSTEGNYTITYDVTDSDGNSAPSVSRIVKVLPLGQNTPPVIILVGQPIVSIVKGLPYGENGATAHDNEDGNITSNIITSGVVNTDIVGEYVITYSITDSGGLSNQISRTIRVLQGNINGVFDDPAVNTEHNIHMVGIDTSSGTLKLVLDGGSGDTTFPFIWIANSGEGTISLLSTETGDELGRYRTGPTSRGNPSRTTVDQDGNVWVGNRSNNTITKIGLNAWDQCIDRNGNGVIDTSTGGTDIKAWGEDECLLQHVTLSKDGLSARYVRLVAVDADNNVFAGGSGSNALFKVNGSTGAIMNAVTTLQNHYGGVIDSDGNIWSMPPNHNRTVQKISHDMSSKENISIGHPGYGIAIDKYGKVWTSSYGNSHFSAFNPSNPTGTLKVFTQTEHSSAQGIAVDSNGDIFIAGSLGGSTVGQYKQIFDDGNFTGVEFVKNHAVQRGPTGVAVDATGKVWASNYYSNSVSKIDPITETVEHFAVGRNPYNYSDMTGNVVRNITEKTGTWEATFDSEDDDYSWNEVKWRLKEALPAETTIKVFAKVSNDEINLAGQVYVEIQNGVSFNLSGRYLKIKIELVSKNLTDTPEVLEIELF